MSKTIRRNHTAYGMIVSGQGRKQVFRDKRERRDKDKRQSWRQDAEKNG